MNVKGIAYSQVTHDLRIGAQKAPEYRAINAQKLVPALVVDDLTLTQSPAILEWLEERYPGAPLLPAAVNDRAIVRTMAALVACDIHPINNLRVLNALRGNLGADEPAIAAWIAHWIGEGFAALEPMVVRHGRGFAFGDTLTIADCCIVPQVYSAQRFGISLTPWPHLAAAAEQARALSAVAAAHPDRQPDADA